MTGLFGPCPARKVRSSNRDPEETMGCAPTSFPGNLSAARASHTMVDLTSARTEARIQGKHMKTITSTATIEQCEQNNPGQRGENFSNGENGNARRARRMGRRFFMKSLTAGGVSLL